MNDTLQLFWANYEKIYTNFQEIMKRIEAIRRTNGYVSVLSLLDVIDATELKTIDSELIYLFLFSKLIDIKNNVDTIKAIIG